MRTSGRCSRRVAGSLLFPTPNPAGTAESRLSRAGIVEFADTSPSLPFHLQIMPTSPSGFWKATAAAIHEIASLWRCSLPSHQETLPPARFASGLYEYLSMGLYPHVRCENAARRHAQAGQYARDRGFLSTAYSLLPN